MRIAIDARAASHTQPGGFKSYAEGLIRGLTAVDSKNNYVLYFDHLNPLQEKLPSNFQCKIIGSTPRPFGTVFREQIAVPLSMARDRVDVSHFLCNTVPLWSGSSRVVTIHDMFLLGGSDDQPRTSGSPYHLLMNSYARLFSVWAAKSANAIITISLFSASEIVKKFPHASGHVHIVPQAADSIFKKIDRNSARQTVTKQLGLKPEYVLVLGSASPHKNVEGAIRAYSLLPIALRCQHPLTIVLAHRALRTQLEKLCRERGILNDTSILINQPRTMMPSIFANAAVLLFPSLYEGFGMPPLEAMSCGTPVITSNMTALPEVVGDAAELVNPNDEPAMAQSLMDVLTNSTRRNTLVESGLRRAQLFSWERTAQLTLEVYHHVSMA